MPAALSGHDDRSGEDRSTGVDRATAARGSPHAEWVERSRPPVYWRWLIPSPDGRMLNVAGPQRLRHPRRRTPRCTAAPLDGCDRSTGARPPAMKHRLRARGCRLRGRDAAPGLRGVEHAAPGRRGTLRVSRSSSSPTDTPLKRPGQQRIAVIRPAGTRLQGHKSLNPGQKSPSGGFARRVTALQRPTGTCACTVNWRMLTT